MHTYFCRRGGAACRSNLQGSQKVTTNTASAKLKAESRNTTRKVLEVNCFD
jgi:hypothetical protein